MRRQYSTISLAGTCCALLGCASVTSKPYPASGGVDGVLYKLPATEIIAVSTWQIVRCNPVRLKIEDIEVSYRTVADETIDNWFMIDPDDLAGLFSSVDPARFELNNGVISKVSFKATSEVGPLIKESIGLAAKLAVSAGKSFVQEPSEDFKCTDDAQRDFDIAIQSKNNAGNAIKEAKLARDGLQKRFYEKPSPALKLAVDRADSELAAAINRQNTLSASWPWIKINSIARPDTTRNATQCAQAQDLCFVLDPDVSPYKSRFDDLTKLEGAVAVIGHMDAQDPPRISSSLPSADGYRGLYYKLPAWKRVVISDKKEKINRVVERTPMLHLGQLARVELSNGLFTNSGYEIAFDPSGGIATYSMTSSSIVKDTVTAIRGAVEESDAARLQALKMKADLIEAEQRVKQSN